MTKATKSACTRQLTQSNRKHWWFKAMTCLYIVAVVLDVAINHDKALLVIHCYKIHLLVQLLPISPDPRHITTACLHLSHFLPGKWYRPAAGHSRWGHWRAASHHPACSPVCLQAPGGLQGGGPVGRLQPGAEALSWRGAGLHHCGEEV